MEHDFFIFPGTTVVDSIKIGPFRIGVAPRLYHDLAALSSTTRIRSLHLAGLGNPDITLREALRIVRAHVAVHGPINYAGHSQSGFQGLRMFVEEPSLFAEFISLDGPIHGSEAARAGSRIASGFNGMLPHSVSVKRLHDALNATALEDRQRIHLYAAADGIFILPHAAALYDLPGIDNIWVGRDHAAHVRSYSRLLQCQHRAGHLDLIRKRSVLDDIRQIIGYVSTKAHFDIPA